MLATLVVLMSHQQHWPGEIGFAKHREWLQNHQCIRVTLTRHNIIYIPKNYEEINESSNILGALKDPSLLQSFKTHIAVVI